MKQVLIVDDEAAMRVALESSFQRSGWNVQTAAGAKEAVAKFRSAPARLVVTDMCMPDGDGLEVMQEIRLRAPGTPVIFLTAYGSVPGAVQAIKEGACDYLQKPVAFEELIAVAKRFLRDTPQANSESEALDGFGRSPAFLAAMERARRAAATEADILIEAESGTGKELLARLIHKGSARSSGPFVAVNCSAFPDNLLESELFGHVRGAFTGANMAKPGKFELASGGMLLLDEIGEMPLSLQPKLLRVLQQREIDRLGDTRPLPVDVRVIATTNRSLREHVEAGGFRADLFYRLNVVPLSLPSLRERREDILPLAEHFLRKYEPQNRAGSYRIAPELAARLEAHDWPGNIRELENFIRGALALAGSTALNEEQFQPNELPKQSAGGNVLHPGLTLQEAERKLLEKTLEATGGNRTKAAELMGVSLRTVRNKIREYGLPAWRAM
jgi:DNA-binding NtrC family response regulator